MVCALLMTVCSLKMNGEVRLKFTYLCLDTAIILSHGFRRQVCSIVFNFQEINQRLKKGKPVQNIFRSVRKITKSDY
jgi:hypothetical protein